MTRTSRLMIPVLLLAFALRLHLLGDAPVWWDEGWTVWLIRHPLGSVPSLAAQDVHPPLYFLLLWPWRLLAGESTFALRYFSVTGGMLVVALVYRLGSDWLSPWAGLLAALLAALSRFAVWWSQEMRMYTLATVLGLLTLHAAVRWYCRGKLRDGMLYVLFTVSSLYTFYLSALYALVANLWMGAMIWRRTDRWFFLRRWIVAQLAAIFLFIPWLAVTLRGRGSWLVATPFDHAAFLRLFWTLFTVGVPTDLTRWAGIVGILLILFLLGMAAAWPQLRSRGEVATLLTIGILVPPALVYVLATTPALRFLYAPRVQARYLSLFLPAFHLLFAWGLVAWFEGRPHRVTHTANRGKLVTIAAAIGLTVLATLLPLTALADYYTGRWPEDRYRSVADTLYAFRLPEEPVVLHTDRSWPVFDYDADLPANSWHGIPYGAQVTEQQAAQLLAPLWTQSSGVWLVTNRDALRVDPQGTVAGWLATRAAWRTEFRYGLATLTLYARDPDRVRPPRLPAGQGIPRVAVHASLGDPDPGEGAGWTLLGYDLPLRRVRAGDTNYLALYWQGSSTALPVRLSLRNPSGEETLLDTWTIPASADGVRIRTQHALAIPPNLAAGRYRLDLLSSSYRIPLAQLSVGRRPTLPETSLPSYTHPIRVRFGPALWLAGYDLPTISSQPGDVIPVTLYWQTTGAITGQYKVFVHLLGEVYNADQQNFLWGQQDAEPLRGEPPLSAWPPNQLMADGYELPVQPNAPAGRYQIEVGLYDPLTGERLPVFDESGNPLGDRLLLADVQISPVPDGQ